MNTSIHRLHPLVAAAAIAVIATCAAATWTILHQAQAQNNQSPTAVNSRAAPTNNTAKTVSATAPKTSVASSKNGAPRAVPPNPQPAVTLASAPAIDPNLGRIERIQVNETRPKTSSGIGAVAGGVLGGLLGNQVGKGSGKTAATVAGVVGGAVAGHHVERHVKTEKIWTLQVRMDDGTTRTLTQKTEPGWQVGERVRWQEGRLLTPNGQERAAPTPTVPTKTDDEYYRQA